MATPSLPEQRVEYLDFEVSVITVKRGVYRASVRSAAGEDSAPFKMPYKADQLEKQLLVVENAILRSGLSGRQALSPQSKEIRDFGQKLFEALLPGDLQGLFRTTRALAREAGTGVRIRLNIEPAGLAAIPWEFLYDSRSGEYICLSAQTPIVRHLSLAQPIPQMEVAAPLRILGMVASPSGLEPLNTDNEKRRVQDALSDLIQKNAVVLHWLEGQTKSDLQHELRQGAYHVFHFVGHGGFDREKDEGFIALANDYGARSDCSASVLATLLADEPTLRLVILNSCEGATGGGKDVFSSTASIVLRRGDVAAVVAMQYQISDHAAITFAREIYRAIAAGLPVDIAVAEGRKALMGRDGSAEWATPVLHLRSRDGLLFTPVLAHARSGEATPPPEAEARAGEATGAEPPAGRLHVHPRSRATWLWVAAIALLAGLLIGTIPRFFGDPGPESTPTVSGDAKVAAAISDIRLDGNRCIYWTDFCMTSEFPCGTTPQGEWPGVVVKFTATIVAPVGTPVPITYSVFDNEGQTVIRDEKGWPVDAIIPKHPEDQGEFEIWIPHQTTPGPYNVEVTLRSPFASEVPLVSATTQSFNEDSQACL
jgi:hypothetical protein